MDDILKMILSNDENVSEEEKKKMASGLMVSVLATIGSLFEVGAEIKVDNDGRSIQITGYDNLDEEYNHENIMGSSQCMRERVYAVDVEIGEVGSFDSNLSKVMDEIERDNKTLKTVPSSILS